MSGIRRYRQFVPALTGFVVVLVVSIGVVWLIKDFMASSGGAKKQAVQPVTLIAPPPPPPPPPEIEQPPEPEIEEEVEVPEPENIEDLPDAASDAPPPGESLGLDAEGGAGSDGFGLVGRKGGRGLLSGGVFGAFSRQLQDDIHETLHANERLRSRRYTVIVSLWIGRAGNIERAELVSGTGTSELDALIAAKLSTVRVAQAPPLEMPQPIRIRITSRL